MARITNSLDINIQVSLPDDRTVDLDLTVAAELYRPEEYPLLINDIFERAARAVTTKLAKDTE
jgi:hypothetical protein